MIPQYINSTNMKNTANNNKLLPFVQYIDNKNVTHYEGHMICNNDAAYNQPPHAAEALLGYHI